MEVTSLKELAYLEYPDGLIQLVFLKNAAKEDDQMVYTIFDDEDEALVAAQNIVNEVNNVECAVYGKNITLILLVSPGN